MPVRAQLPSSLQDLFDFQGSILVFRSQTSSLPAGVFDEVVTFTTESGYQTTEFPKLLDSKRNHGLPWLTVPGAVDLLEGNHSLQKRYQPLPERDRWIVPNLHLHAIGAALDVPTQEQADYSGVKFEGPFNATLVA